MKERPYQPYQDHLIALARSNRKNPTPAEQKMWSDILRGKQLMGLKFSRQKPIDGYIVDFYCASLGLVIEIDGDSHTDKVEYDVERTRILNAYGLCVIRYTNREVLSNPESVYQHLTTELTIRQRTLCSSADKPKKPIPIPALIREGSKKEVLASCSSPDKGRLGGVSSA